MKTPEYGGIYVQSITGYEGQSVYDEKAKLLANAGFICLRSESEEEGKYCEIWYLPGLWRGKGPIKDKKTLDDVRQWVGRAVRPGTIALEGKRYALVVD